MKKKSKSIRSKDVYAIITERIITQLENGTIPWRQNWVSRTPPLNLLTKKAYRGINHLLLSTLNYENNYFLTVKQLNSIGAKVKKGEKSIPVVFWKVLEYKNDVPWEDEVKKIPYLRYYNVFNIEQCENIPENLIPKKVIPGDNNPIQNCEAVVRDMPHKPEIIHSDVVSAYYNPFKDFINVPLMRFFDTSASYYSVLFHELVHSTGHENRLARKSLIEITSYGTETYSFEELVAEIGACFLNAHAGIANDQFDNNVAYIQGWLSRLRNDKKLIVKAGMEAQKAVDFILGYNPKESETQNNPTPVPSQREAIPA